MITQFSTYSDKPIKSNSNTGATSSKNYSGLDWLPTAGGAIGSILGYSVGGPIGGGIGGGIGGSVGEGVNELASGQAHPLTQQAIGNTKTDFINNMNPVRVGSGIDVPNLLSDLLGLNKGKVVGSGLEQGIYGAIPGGKVGGGIVKNALTRSIGGGIGGAATQAVRNVQQGQPITKDLLGQGIATGALNTIIPGAAGALHMAGKVPTAIGNKIAETTSGVLERKGMPALDVITQLFGGRAIDTQGGKAFINPDVSRVIQEHNIPIPPKDSLQGFGAAIKQAQSKVEEQLRPLLQSKTAITADVQQLLNEYKAVYAPGDRKFLSQLPQSARQILTTNANQVDLYTLKQVQRDLGKVANWAGGSSTPLEKFAKDAYSGLDAIIQQELGKVANASNKDLINQHRILIAANDNFRNITGGNKLSDQLISQSLGEQKRMGGTLSQLRENQNVMRAGLATMLPITAAIPGVPGPVKVAAGLAELGLMGPTAFPELGGPMQKAFSGAGKAMQAPAGNEVISKLLQQIGARIPGLGQ